MAESLHAPNVTPFENGAFEAASTALIAETLERVKARIVERMHVTDRYATGDTERSMVIEQYVGGARLIGRPYMQSLELGREPGPVPYNMRDIIKRWIIAKGITPTQIPYKTSRQHKYSVEERSLNAMAGAIAHTIETKGTVLYRQGGEENVYTPVLDNELPVLKEKLGILIVNMINNGR